MDDERRSRQRRAGRRHAASDVESRPVPAAQRAADAVLQGGPVARGVVGDAAHEQRRRPDVERGRRLPDGILGPIKNKPVQLADGTILAPTSTESHTEPSRWQVHFERSSDGGKTWTATQALNDGIAIEAIQPSILFHEKIGGDKLLALGRTQQGKVFSTSSDDGGKTWSAMSLIDSLPNPERRHRRGDARRRTSPHRLQSDDARAVRRWRSRSRATGVRGRTCSRSRISRASTRIRRSSRRRTAACTSRTRGSGSG